MCVYVCVCVSPQMCMRWVGWLYVPPCHLVAPTGSANATVWVTLRQFAPHRFIFVSKCYFFTGSVSAYGLPPSCCCFHHYCCFFFVVVVVLSFFLPVLFLWLYLTALNCCSPGCYLILFFKSVSVWGGLAGVMLNTQDAVK